MYILAFLNTLIMYITLPRYTANIISACITSSLQPQTLARRPRSPSMLSVIEKKKLSELSLLPALTFPSLVLFHLEKPFFLFFFFSFLVSSGVYSVLVSHSTNHMD